VDCNFGGGPDVHDLAVPALPAPRGRVARWLCCACQRPCSGFGCRHILPCQFKFVSYFDAFQGGLNGYPLFYIAETVRDRRRGNPTPVLPAAVA